MQDRKIKKLNLIKRLLNNQLNVAATKYSNVVRVLKSEMDKQQQLQIFKSHYHNNIFNNNASNSAFDIKQKSAFIAQISQALTAQQKTILNMQQDMEVKKNVWLDIRNKFNKLSEYIAEMEEEAMQELEVREQKALDTLVNDLHTKSENFKDD